MTSRSNILFPTIGTKKLLVVFAKLDAALTVALAGYRHTSYVHQDKLALFYQSVIALIMRRRSLLTEAMIDDYARENYNHRALTIALPLAECLADVRGWRKSIPHHKYLGAKGVK